MTARGTSQVMSTGYVDVDGTQVYWESRGIGGTPLVLVHGGFGVTTSFGALAEQWARDRQVVALELQGHGHTALGTAALSFDALGDQVAAVAAQVGAGPVDILGYSLGGLAALRAAIRHPEAARRLVLVSSTCRRGGWFPDVLLGMGSVSSAGFEQMRHTPMYEAYAAVAPQVQDFPRLMDAVGALLGAEYDWTAAVPGLAPDTLLVLADADSIPITHAAEFFASLGGGLRDAGWDGADRPRHRLAVLPGRTHYDVLQAPTLPAVVTEFLG